MKNINKIFIVGLPRTGTTSICIALLELGYRVAHTAYTQDAMEMANVIADTPVFCDYKELDHRYPESKFIYLDRKMSAWLPSIQQLLQRMHKNLTRPDGGFNPDLKRCFKSIFEPMTEKNITQSDFLENTYKQHKINIETYFKDRPDTLLSVDICQVEDNKILLDFLNLDQQPAPFPHVNKAGKITYWNTIKHPLKVDSHFKKAISQ